MSERSERGSLGERDAMSDETDRKEDVGWRLRFEEAVVVVVALAVVAATWVGFVVAPPAFGHTRVCAPGAVSDAAVTGL